MNSSLFVLHSSLYKSSNPSGIAILISFFSALILIFLTVKSILGIRCYAKVFVKTSNWKNAVQPLQKNKWFSGTPMKLSLTKKHGIRHNAFGNVARKDCRMGHIHIGCRVWFSVLTAVPGWAFPVLKQNTGILGWYMIRIPRGNAASTAICMFLARHIL